MYQNIFFYKKSKCFLKYRKIPHLSYPHMRNCMCIVLGNHDYTGDALAQQSPAIHAVDSRWTSINKSFIVDSGMYLHMTHRRIIPTNSSKSFP